MKKINKYIQILILLFFVGLSRNIVAQVSTNQFKGVNWADPRDNFQTGVIYISGLSSTDTYSSASIVADRVVGQFVSKLGSNSVRLPINEATVSNYWNTYTGAIDMALTKGKVIICYWSPSSGADPVNITAFWAMWTKVVAKYGSNPNCYFEVFNEPSNYTKTELLNLYDTWLKNYPAVPQNHIVLDGTGLAMNVPDVGSDPRFSNCLLAVHDYSFFASYTTEQEWRNHLKAFVGAYAHRTIMTEFGAPMKPGTKNGINYGVQDYNSPTGTYFVAYMRGMTSQLREWNMGSFYWPGLRDNDWYSLTTRTGSGANITLTLNNQSGLDRVHYAWGGSSVPQAPYNGTASLIPGTVQLENYDVGGNSYAYNDKTVGNTGGASFRTNEDVDIEMCTDVGGGYNIGFATAGEWLEYTVNVQKAASYDMSFRVACNGAGRTISVSMDGTTLSNAGNIAIPNTTAWQTWTTVTIPNIPLKAGQQVMRVTVGATDYVNLNYVQFTEHVAACVPPSAPSVTSSLTYCQGVIAPALTANGTALKWYTAATTGTGSATAPMPSTTSAGTTNYYVSQTVNGCESNRTQITVTVNAIPSAPIANSPVTYCQGATASALTANGTTLKWYTNATTGTGSATAPMPSTTSAGTTNYYVSQTVNGCESNRTQITVTVNAIPSAPIVNSSVTYCQGATASVLTANGTSLKWYPAATTGTGSATAPMPSTTSVGTQNHYVSQTVNGCESNRAEIAVTVNALPAAPTVTSSLTYCQGATAPALTANGTALKWYTAATTGTGSSTAPIPSTASAGSQNQYVSQTVNGCESSRSLITIVVDAKPTSATVGANQSISSSSATLAANTPVIGVGTWTRISGAGTISNIHDPAAVVSGLSQGSNSFRWTISNGTCSVSSSDLFIVVGQAPVSQVISGPDSTGFGSTVSFSIPAHVGSSYSWTIPNDATIQSGQNSNNIQVAFGSTTVSGIIAVVETNAYGSATSPKNVWSGPAPSIFVINGPATVTEGVSTYTFTVPTIPKTHYNWVVPQGAMIESGQGSNTITVSFPPGANSGALSVTSMNAFGSSVSSIPVTVSTITTNVSSMTKYTHVTVAPNPFVDETSIDFHYKKNAGSALLKVINMQGEIVYESTEFDINETISIGKDLKSGIYIVVVIYENQSYVRTVVKNQ